MSIKSFSPPSLATMDRLLALPRRYFAPRLFGAEHVSLQRPALFVGNHGLYGLIDSPLFLLELYRETGVFPRALGDRLHFRVPGWGALVKRWGAGEGNPDNCTALMQSGQPVLVFPGGAREVAMRKDEVHKLVWKNRTGFARLAIEHGYDIIPFASAGCDQAYRVLVDGSDFQQSRLGRTLLKSPRVDKLLRGGDMFMPLSRGVGPTLVPRPEPLWFQLGAPISTAPWAGKQGDADARWAVREIVAESIESMLLSLNQERSEARQQGWRRWLLKP